MILEIEITEDERKMLLDHHGIKNQSHAKTTLEMLASGKDRVRATFRDASIISGVFGNIESEKRAQTQADRNHAWEKETGRRLGEEMYVDEQGNVHDPLGYTIHRAVAEYYDR